MASLIFNWKLVEAESRIVKQSSEQRERQFSEPCNYSLLLIVYTVILNLIILVHRKRKIWSLQPKLARYSYCNLLDYVVIDY